MGNGERWWERAACLGIPSDIMFPCGNTAGISDRFIYREALSYCSKCPVVKQCLSYAMELETDKQAGRWGVWGGTTPRQRWVLAGEPVRVM